jgi:hypothetical protein
MASWCDIHYKFKLVFSLGVDGLLVGRCPAQVNK